MSDMVVIKPRTDRLRQFVAWAEKTAVGDEKGDAQVFLDRLFQGFGQKGALDVGGKLEFRVRKAAEEGGGIAFADYVWKPTVLIEMKKRGVDLSRHYRQAFDYWTRLVPGRPRYVILCNFEEFWIYDFENQLDTPVDKLTLAELPDRYGPLAFLFPIPEPPVFENDRVKVTQAAADCLANCFNRLITRGIDRKLVQRFILQTLVALFAEDIDLLERYFFTRLLKDCQKPADSYDLIGGLFEAMNTPGRISGGRYKGVDYFNGGLFREPARIELNHGEVAQITLAATQDWSKVNPEIFGTLFQHTMKQDPDDNERRAFGAHFTSFVDIMKIVEPTIVRPWRELIENAKGLKALRKLHERLAKFTVLDPACGSGNFLYVAYREIKRLEKSIIDRVKELGGPRDLGLSFVTAKNFYGIDINPFAVELAKVTLMIGRKLAVDELHLDEHVLPLDNLDANFIAGDALIDEHGNSTSWPRADVIIGNPPFGGAKLLKPQRGADYVNAVRRAYPEVPGMADYCVYWFRKAHDLLPACTADDPVAGRAGLVGTQNVRNNKSREGGLDHIAQTGTIIEAVDNQPWSGEANVHVSIVDWIKTQNPSLLPKKRILWFKVQSTSVKKKPRIKGSGPASKEYELDKIDCKVIGSSLSSNTDLFEAKILQCNQEPPFVFNGQFPRHQGFVITPGAAASFIKKDKNNCQVIHPYLIGREMITHVQPLRWIIDFQKKDLFEAKQYAGPFKWIESTVLPHVAAYASKEKALSEKKTGQDQTWLQTWWQHFRCRKEMVDKIEKLSRFIACAEVTKRPIFCFVEPVIRPDHTLEAFIFEDDYSFGILQSDIHWQWFIAKCSKLTERFRYTPESVFNTFPWPQSPSVARINAVARAGREVRRIRADALKKIAGGLRAVYRTLELPGKNPLKDAHAALDAAVLAAYGFSPKKDILAQLLELNQAVAKRIEAKKSVTAPGVPPNYPDPDSLITDDCIKPNPII